MSSSAPNGSSGPGDERKGVRRLVRRVSRVFRKRSSTKESISGPSGAVKPPSGGAPSEPSAAAVSRYVNKYQHLLSSALTSIQPSTNCRGCSRRAACHRFSGSAKSSHG